MKAVSEMMGHSSPPLTLSTYYHLVEGQKWSALDHLTVPKLDALGKPLGKPQDFFRPLQDNFKKFW